LATLFGKSGRLWAASFLSGTAQPPETASRREETTLDQATGAEDALSDEPLMIQLSVTQLEAQITIPKKVLIAHRLKSHCPCI
jgi:hypothetical protein